ncbi:MAG: extracellular solute-binding protein family 5 [Acidobacteria bacterium]|nr:extracellular solute-binding protein family 5 [Acidobacteriota bacterium]
MTCPRTGRIRRTAAGLLTAVLVSIAQPSGATAAPPVEDLLISRAPVGRYGGQLVVNQRAEPRTLNPVIALDAVSRDVLKCTIAALIHINRETQRTEPALAREWSASPDGRRYTLTLRRGIRFSDGHAFDADDVLFSFGVYLDPGIRSPQRDLLIVGGEPLRVRKIDQYIVQVDLAAPYAGAERLFDGVAILPRHLLEPAFKAGRLTAAWGIAAAPSAMAGLGPFRFKEFVPGERIVLERNPYYWKADRSGQRLPYLDRVAFTVVASDDAQAIRFQAGESDVASRLSAEHFGVLQRAEPNAAYTLADLGAGLDYSFLFFNLNDLGPHLADTSRKQRWFGNTTFRRAVSLAIDRDAIVRLVYRGRATPLWGHVPPGNALWVNRAIPRPPRSVDEARRLLRGAGFSWTTQGALVDSRGAAVEFTILTNAGNHERIGMATIIQDDLQQLGMRVQIVTLELRTLVERVLTQHDYEACVLGLGNGDASPNAEMNVWLSSGGSHLWHPEQRQPATAWEAEIDVLMRRQLTTLDHGARKRLYDRVQALVAQNLPLIFLASPNILVGARKGLGNFRPAVLDHHTLWNIDELFWRQERTRGAP